MTNFYVDNAAAGSNTGTSWANAWTSFAAVQWGTGASQVGPDDTLYISGGSTSKTYTDALVVGYSGTSGHLLTIKAGQDANHNGTVIWNAAGGGPMINLGSRNYVKIDGEYAGARHFKITTTSRGAYALYAYGNADTENVGNILTYIEADNFGNGFTFLYPYLCEISYCYISNISDDVVIDCDGSGTAHSGYDQGCEIHHCILYGNHDGALGFGPDIIQCSNGITVHDNTIVGVAGTLTGEQHQDGVQTGGKYHKIYNNSFFGLANSGADSDMGSGTVGYIRIWNNLFMAASDTPLRGGWWGGTQGSGSTLTDFKIWNNTFVDIHGTGATYGIDIDNVGTTYFSDCLLQNNLFYNCSGSILCYGAPAAGITISNNDEMTGPTAFVTYSEFGGLSNNLRLAAGATGDIGQGANLSTLWGYDKDGTAWPAVGAWDIGAYKYGSAPIRTITLSVR